MNTRNQTRFVHGPELTGLLRIRPKGLPIIKGRQNGVVHVVGIAGHVDVRTAAPRHRQYSGARREKAGTRLPRPKTSQKYPGLLVGLNVDYLR